MAEFKNFRKADLKVLAEELEVEIETGDTIMKISAKIKDMPDFDLEFCLAQLKIIEQDRLAELASQEKLREREQQNEHELKLETKKLELELEKAKLGLNSETVSQVSNSSMERVRKTPLSSIMQKFNPEKSDLALYLILFERQAERMQLEDEEKVNNLLTLVPQEIAEMILREPAEKIDDYEHVRQMLLDRYKLSSEAYRSKFLNHPKQINATWRDLIFELSTYLEGWISGVGIKTFEELKSMMICEQIKKRVGGEVKDHFIDIWSKTNDPHDLAKKLDEYDIVKRPRKSWNDKFRADRRGEKSRFDKPRDETKLTGVKEDSTKDVQRIKTLAYEKRKAPACYTCGSLSHLKYNCNRGKETNIKTASNVQTCVGFDKSFKPYLSTALVNRETTTILRDTGADVDLISETLIKPQQLTGKTVWIKQPLEPGLRCIPLAEVELEVNGVKIKTQAGVVGRQVDMNHYLLGNKTQLLLEQAKTGPSLVNAVVTRGAARRGEETIACRDDEREKPQLSSRGEYLESVMENLGGEEEISEAQPESLAPFIQNARGDEEAEDIVLPCSAANPVSELAEYDKVKFLWEQKNDDALTELWERASQNKSGYEVLNSLLFRVSKDHRGETRKQLIVPTKLRRRILELCHEGVGGHMGNGKTKDKVLRCYFWPNAIKEIEEYVRACDPCQRVGKDRDAKKAPLKLVPVVSEIFSKISADTVGPLPESENHNKYILTAICVSSKYPEAIPIPNLKSETIVSAFIIMFSRIGYPRHLQLDSGKYFTSNLTMAFFKKFGIQIDRSSVMHPASNSVERWHKTVKRLLKVLCIESGDSWEKNLPFALLTLRTVTHDSTGFSPSELVHGKNLRTPETLLYEQWTDAEGEDKLVTEYVLDLINRMKRCQDLAIENMTIARDKRKVWYDRGAVERNFSPGDKVLVLTSYKPNKLAVNWVGPGVVEKKISETNYVVGMPGRRRASQIFHVNLMKPYYQRDNLVNAIESHECTLDPLENDLEIEFPSLEGGNVGVTALIEKCNLEGRLTTYQVGQLAALLKRYEHIFSDTPGCTDLVEHDIELTEEKPIKLRAYRTSPRQAEILKTEIKRMLDLGIIKEGVSDFTSPMILVEAPGKDPRPCIDYRHLNSITKAKYFPLPNIEERVEKVAKAKFITVVDLTKGYWQIKLTPRAQRYAAFSTNWGVFLPLRMTFGLVGASFTFAKFMSELLKNLEEFSLPYLDDTAIFSNTWEDHLEHLETVFQRISDAKLHIKLAKCEFAKSSVKYLGHMVGNGKRTPTEAKVQAIIDFPAPRNKTEIRRLLGMCGYYSRYLKNYSRTVEPLTRALKGKNKKEKVTWTVEMEGAFKKLKKDLTEGPVLYAPNYQDKFIVQTDASGEGIGVVLAQRDRDAEHPILYLSRKFSESEKKFCTTERECAAIIFAIKKLKHYLDGQNFVIETDHNPLVWLKNNAGNNARLIRWALTLQPYLYTIKHRPGKDIPHVDCLSRA